MNFLMAMNERNKYANKYGMLAIVTIFEQSVNFVDLWITAFKRCIKSGDVIHVFFDDVRSKGTRPLHLRWV